MKRSYYEIYIHIIWATKNREPMIKSSVEDDIIKIAKEKCTKFNVDLISFGSTEDHVHLLLSINPNVRISDLLAEIKGSTSYFVNHNTKLNLYWQDGYGVVSISKPALEKVKEYIENQKEHHNVKSSMYSVLEKIDIC